MTNFGTFHFSLSRLFPSPKRQFPAPLRWLLAMLCFLTFLLPAHAAPGTRANEATLRAAVADAVAVSHPGALNPPAPRIISRGDLDENVSKLALKAADVSFYEAQASSTDPTAERSIWAVVSHDSPLEPYGLYDFEASQRPDQAALEFNRLVSQLGLSVNNTNASELAHFFLACCVLGEPGDPVANEDMLHHSIERNYMQVFGEDVYRSLWSFSEWWQGYTASAYEFPPAVEPEDGGGFHVALEMVVLNFGMHPQLQQFNFEVSRDAKIEVGPVNAIFPREERWLSYDSRNEVPQFHGVGDELQRLKALIKH